MCIIKEIYIQKTGSNIDFYFFVIILYFLAIKDEIFSTKERHAI